MDQLFVLEGRLCQCLIESSQASRLKFCMYDFCQNRKIFKKYQDFTVDINHEVKDVIGICVKLNTLTGFDNILLSVSTKIATEHVFILDRSCRLITHLDILSSSKQWFYFIDGPALLRCKFDNDLIYRKLAGKQKEQVLLKNVSVKSLLWSGYCREINSVAVFLLIVKNGRTEHFTFFINCCTGECLTMDSRVFIPKELINLVTANVIHISQGDLCGKSSYHSEITSFTCEGYFIYLQGGGILWALPTSIVDVKRSVLFTWSAFSINMQFSAIYGNGTVSFISLKERKIINQVRDVAAVYQDDFVGGGQSQILCLHSGFTWESPSDWLLTDKGVWLFDQQGTDKDHDESDHQPAVFALQKRLQTELISFHKKFHVVDKERSEFIRNSWNLVLQGQLQSQVGGSMQERILQMKTSHISVEKIWQIVHDDKWLVGVIVINTCESLLQDLSLSLSSTNRDSRKSQNVLHSASQWLVSEDPESRSAKVKKQGSVKVSKSDVPPSYLQPTEKGVVVCQTDLPSFASHPEVNCEVILTFTICDKSENEEIDWNKNQKRIKLWCGTVTINTSSLIEGRYDIVAGSRKTTLDRWSQRAVSLLTQVTCHLEVKATWSNVSLLGDWLENLCDFHYSTDENVYKSPLQVFCRTKLVIQPHPSHDMAYLVVLADSENDVLMLTHHLYSRLADDLVISPRLDAENGEELHRAIEAIKKEINVIKPKRTETGSRTVKMAKSELPESDDNGSVLVNNIRENFRKRKEEANKYDTESDQSSAETSSLSLYELQQQTDKAIAELEL